MTAIQAAQPKAFHYEARRYCEEHNLPSEKLERVRLSMAFRELQERMEPWQQLLVKLHPAMYSPDHNAPLPPEYLQLQAQVMEVRRMVANELGIELATSP